MSRENTCVTGHVDEHEKIAKQKRARLAQGTGQRVEVFVAQQREWYEGRVVDNGVIAGTALLSVKFGNGAILHNVWSTELRRVARTTLVGWLYTIQFLLFSGGAVAFHAISVAHNVGLPFEE